VADVTNPHSLLEAIFGLCIVETRKTGVAYQCIDTLGIEGFGEAPDVR
jgi:hypothetical protein